MSKRSAPKGSKSACRPADRRGPSPQNMLKHLCSAISYGGASTLAELKARFWKEPARYLIKLSDAGRRESFDR